MNIEENKIYRLLILLITLISTIALFGKIIEPDGALYASIAKNMVVGDEFMNLYVRGLNWLDKPHLPFWLAAISYKIFGINSFAYKLPSFLVGLLGAWYTFKFAKELYTEKVGLISALMVLTALHVLTSTFDVRAEIFLMSFTFAAIYHFYKAENNSFWHVVLGALFSALAIMVKGIFVLITVFAGCIFYWLFTKQFKQFIKLKWWLALGLIFVFITPELYSLYVQFDLHPELEVFGRTNVSGLKFFFWDSQFGRFFNNGPIKGKGDLSFFIHTTLWAFLPWAFLLFAGVYDLFKNKNKYQFRPAEIYILISAAATFLIFSLSKFQLPHYILIIFPQFAIISAVFLSKLEGKKLKNWIKIQNVIYVIMLILIIGISYFFEFEGYWICILICTAILISGFFLFKSESHLKIMGLGTLTATALMVFLSVFFFPSVVKYLAGIEASEWLNKNHPNNNTAVLMHGESFTFDFYSNATVKYYWSHEELSKSKPQNLYLYTPESEIDYLKSTYKVDILKSFDYYHVTKLTPKFINVKTRPSTLERFFLVKIM